MSSREVDANGRGGAIPRGNPGLWAGDRGRRIHWRFIFPLSSATSLTKEGNPNTLSIPVHKGKDLKQGFIRGQVAKAGLTPEEFLKLYGESPKERKTGQRPAASSGIGKKAHSLILAESLRRYVI